MNYLAQRLRELRRAANLTLKTASTDVDISLTYLSDVERGRTIPSLLVLERLLALYGQQLTIVSQEAGLPQLLKDGVEQEREPTT